MATDRQLDALGQSEAAGFAGTRVHLIGVGGSGMCALAAMLLDQEAVVSGSDMAGSSVVERLAGRGAAISVGQRAENIPDQCDLVVHSAAIHKQNPELLAARQRGVAVIKYSRMLGRLMARKVGIAISGTHGKSTTTAMVAYALRAEGADPSYVIGATVDQLGGPSAAGAGRHFVAEACEFDRSFLDLEPTCAAILNIDEDHLDCYADLEAIIEAFRSFASRVRPDGMIIANGEDRNVSAALVTGSAPTAACEVETFGLSRQCRWRGRVLARPRGCVRMDVLFDGHEYCRVAFSLPGLHNAYNGLAAAAVCHHAGLASESIGRRLGEFAGARRRMQFRGEVGGVTVVDDYAHHPTEIQASLKAVRDYYQPKRLLCVFQPHQHSRTRFLLKDFARCFDGATEVILPDIYFVRDSEREKDHISSEDLVSQIRFHGGSARYIETFDEIVGFLQAELRAGDVVVTMGAGNIWEVADEIVRWLGRDR